MTRKRHAPLFSMLVPFLIMLREGIEAALIVGIVAGYLKQTGRGGWMPVVWVGILLALTMSLAVGAALQWLSAEFPQKAQELFEAVVGLVAVVMLTTMVLWMRRAARGLAAQLRDAVDAALSSAGGQAWALVLMVFLAVAREGLESVFFLLAAFQQGGSSAFAGALLGVLAAAVLGYAIYVGGVRLDLRRFFRWTGLFILLVAAGLLAGAVRALHEAGLWNLGQTVLFDLGHVLPADGPLGTVLAGVLGYHEAPVFSEAVAYLAYLAVTLPWFLRPVAYPPVARGSATSFDPADPIAAPPKAEHHP